MDISKGRYWDKPWSLVDGCTPVSAACDHCWLAGIEHRFRDSKPLPPDGCSTPLTIDGRFNGIIKIREDRLSIPLRTRKQTIFAIWSDLFHEKVPNSFIQAAYLTMAKTRLKHTFLVLTKRPARLAQAWPHPSKEWPHINIWHGTTIENQQTADERIPHLLNVPGKRFLSIEPLLGSINLFDGVPGVFGTLKHRPYLGNIHAVICGGESGHGARPMHPDWVRSLRDQCATEGVPFFFKQWGEWWPGEQGRLYRGETIDWADGQPMVHIGKKKAGRVLDGRTHDDLPWVNK